MNKSISSSGLTQFSLPVSTARFLIDSASFQSPRRFLVRGRPPISRKGCTVSNYLDSSHLCGKALRCAGHFAGEEAADRKGAMGYDATKDTQKGAERSVGDTKVVELLKDP